MNKDFDVWNRQKKSLDSKKNKVSFRDGEVWFAYLGINVGHEQNGDTQNFLRPVVIIKKLSNSMLLAIPLTTNLKSGRYRLFLGRIGNKKAVALIAQMRVIDAKRLKHKIAVLDDVLIKTLKARIFVVLDCNKVSPQDLNLRGRGRKFGIS